MEGAKKYFQFDGNSWCIIHPYMQLSLNRYPYEPLKYNTYSMERTTDGNEPVFVHCTIFFFLEKWLILNCTSLSKKLYLTDMKWN
jgi:hypothetical protein